MNAKTSSIGSVAFAMFIWLPILNILDVLCFAVGYLMQIDLVTLITGEVPPYHVFFLSPPTLWKIKYFFLSGVMELIAVMLFYSWLRKSDIERIKKFLDSCGSLSKPIWFILVAILAFLSFRLPCDQIIVLSESEVPGCSIIESKAQNEVQAEFQDED